MALPTPPSPERVPTDPCPSDNAFKIRILVPYSPLGLLDVSPIGFQSQTFWGLISPVQVPEVRVPDVGFKPHASQGYASFS